MMKMNVEIEKENLFITSPSINIDKLVIETIVSDNLSCKYEDCFLPEHKFALNVGEIGRFHLPCFFYWLKDNEIRKCDYYKESVKNFFFEDYILLKQTGEEINGYCDECENEIDINTIYLYVPESKKFYHPSCQIMRLMELNRNLPSGLVIHEWVK